jgi:exonuclease III
MNTSTTPNHHPSVPTTALAALLICTFNARSLLSAVQLKDFELQAKKSKFDVIGLAEVRRRGNGRLDLNSGYILFHSGKKDQSLSGVGFFISQNWANRLLE